MVTDRPPGLGASGDLDGLQPPELGVGTRQRDLADLGPEWTVLHAVPVGAKASDIDDVLIGPAGRRTSSPG